MYILHLLYYLIRIIYTYCTIQHVHIIAIALDGVVAEWIGHSAFSAVVAGSNPSSSGWDLQS